VGGRRGVGVGVGVGVWRGRGESGVVRYREVALPEGEEYRLVGRKIRVFWPLEQRFFQGEWPLTNLPLKQHRIVYNDGDKEWVSLSQELFRLQVFSGESWRYPEVEQEEDWGRGRGRGEGEGEEGEEEEDGSEGEEEEWEEEREGRRRVVRGGGEEEAEEEEAEELEAGKEGGGEREGEGRGREWRG